MKCLEFLKHKHVEITLMKETHLKFADINRLQNKLYKVFASSSASNMTKRVLILVSWKINLSVITSGSDNEGRFCFVIATLYNSKICLASIYTPNVLNTDFFDTIKFTLMAFSDAILILEVDFNLLVDPDVDSSNPVPASQRASSSYITSFFKGFKYCWCLAFIKSRY